MIASRRGTVLRRGAQGRRLASDSRLLGRPARPARRRRRHPDVRVGSSPQRASWGVRRVRRVAVGAIPMSGSGRPRSAPPGAAQTDAAAPSAAFRQMPPPHLLRSDRCRRPICCVPTDAPRPIGHFPADGAPAPHKTDARAQDACARAYLVVISLSKGNDACSGSPEHAMGVKSETAGTLGANQIVPASNPHAPPRRLARRVRRCCVSL